ncbi:MAG TPA: polyprenol phosphomannose-dependent alpha 1,6 mannosyltransferase MptB [Solirubrobacteraceae bacterium]|nr:polyprenol phosphomannose-dependent alpha 1,6 mannosyltransferase MptB [Solirubrobacteraceae bacterium]
MARARDGRGAAWAWVALGACGSVLVALAGTELAGVGFWFHLRIGRTEAEWMHYAGLALMCAAWLGLGLCLRALSGRRLWAIGVLWALPALFGPVLFSQDVYSYIAQGDLLRLGLNPYKVVPAVLAHHGQRHVLGAVAPFWQHTTAPYGPLFLALVSPISSLANDHGVLAALVVKVLDAFGLVLLGVFVPRLARAVGSDPRRAAWLAVLSPLVLLQVVAAGHNDGLMAGLMVAGVVLAVEGRTIPAVALCALAAMIKLPAAAACPFIAVAAARSEPDVRAQVQLLVRALAAFVAVLVVVSAATTVGTEWLTTGVFSTPSMVRLALTPAVALGYTTASLLHDLGVSAQAHSVESGFEAAAGVIVILLALVLLRRVRRPTLVRDLGLVLLAAAIGGPAAWPWYLIWGLALLATWPAAQRSLWMMAVVTVPVFLIRPGGIALPPRPWSPIVLGVYAVLVLSAWLLWRRRRGGARRAVPALT